MKEDLWQDHSIFLSEFLWDEAGEPVWCLLSTKVVCSTCFADDYIVRRTWIFIGFCMFLSVFRTDTFWAFRCSESTGLFIYALILCACFGILWIQTKLLRNLLYHALALPALHNLARPRVCPVDPNVMLAVSRQGVKSVIWLASDTRWMW